MANTKLIAPLLCLSISAQSTFAADQEEPVLTTCIIDFDHSYSLDELLDQFRDDENRYNYLRAKKAFYTHPDLTIEYLYNALNHEDWQVRQIICTYIWSRQRDKEVFQLHPRKEDGSWNGGYYETIPADPQLVVTDDLVRVTIEGLRDDPTPYQRNKRRALCITNAKLGTKALIPHAHKYAREIIEAMESDDFQQRFFAAYILARAGVSHAIERSTEILLPHLRDNDIKSDAKFAVYALGGFGEELLPIITRTLPFADHQQRDLLTLVMINIKNPPQNKEDLVQRSQYNSITRIVYDPSQEEHKDNWNFINQIN